MLATVFEPCLRAKTMGELMSSLIKVNHQLGKLNIFKECSFIIDSISEDEDIIRAKVEERRFRINAGTELRKNEIAFGFGAILFNALGRAEVLDVNAAVGSQSATPLSVTLSKPINGDPDRMLNVSLYSTLQHYLNGTNYKNRLQGFNASYSFPTQCGIQHEFKYCLDWRHVFGIADAASASIRRSAGHTIKSSIAHTMSICTRDSLIFPSRGVFAKISNELAGLGGSVKYLKTEMQTRVHVPIYKLLSLKGTLRAGNIMPLGINSNVPLIDRFQMGGPLSVRGFALNSIGPKDRHDPIGGTCMMEASFGLSFPITPGTSEMLRGHLFANTGLLANLSSSASLSHNIRHLYRMKPSVSLGAGLQMSVGGALLELNCAHPVSVSDGAVFNRGIQLGLGLEFL